MSEEEDFRKAKIVLELTLGWQHSSTYQLALQVRDLIWSDRQIIKILGRNIESLTMQMKEITQVTFERDQLKEAIEVYKARIDHFKERLAKYE